MEDKLIGASTKRNTRMSSVENVNPIVEELNYLLEEYVFEGEEIIIP